MVDSGRFLIVTWEGGGNVPPAIALGYRLTMAGHDVTVLGVAPAAAEPHATTLRYAPYTTLPPLPPGQALDADSSFFANMLNGVGAANDVIELAARVRPDVLVIDGMMGAAYAAAEVLGLPTAILVHVLYRPFVDLWGQFVIDAAAPRTALGLPPAESSVPADLLAAADVVLNLTPPGFDADGPQIPANTHYVGPIVSPYPPDPRDEFMPTGAEDHTFVLVSYSTTEQGQRGALPPLLKALGTLPVGALLTLGGVVRPDELDVPGNVTALDYVPHTAILPRASAVICHGGLSTIMASLCHGVPLLCIPQGREQPLNAERVEATGVGRTVAPDAPADDIAVALNSILEDPSYRAAAVEMSHRIHACGNKATELVMGLLGSRPHV